jgi:hypothetical protein
MVGCVEPLQALQDPARRESIVRRIIGEYPLATLEAP